jgi:cyclopropane-fatty-acyl-phospholipid synthase
MLLSWFLRRIVRQGTLVVVDARGRRESLGGGGLPSCTIRLSPKLRELGLLGNPSLFLGEAYMNGLIVIEDGTIGDLLEVLLVNYRQFEQHPIARIARTLGRQGRHLQQHNPLHRAQRNVAHHYDLSDDLYALFLDSDRQYSCAYFQSPTDSLEEAQLQKKQHIAAKLLIDRPGLRVLDIGSGWGGMALYLAQTAGCTVDGLTLSKEQFTHSQNRAKKAEPAQRVAFHLRDYREESGLYDRIVSVGMFEHVGKRNYAEFFKKVGELLNDDGICLLHTIGRLDAPAPVNPFIRKYIFPGTDVPTLSEIMSVVETSGLFTTDVEILRLHYAETLKLWRERFVANRERIVELYDERFCRMWDLYLTSCEMGFRYDGLAVFQIQLSKRFDTVPITRDYMVDRERAEYGALSPVTGGSLRKS